MDCIEHGTLHFIEDLAIVSVEIYAAVLASHYDIVSRFSSNHSKQNKRPGRNPKSRQKSTDEFIHSA